MAVQELATVMPGLVVGSQKHPMYARMEEAAAAKKAKKKARL